MDCFYENRIKEKSPHLLRCEDLQLKIIKLLRESLFQIHYQEPNQNYEREVTKYPCALIIVFDRNVFMSAHLLKIVRCDL